MKTLILIPFLFLGCNKVNDTGFIKSNFRDSSVENIGETGVIYGSITYRDVLSDRIYTENSDIVTEINTISNGGLPQELSKISSGSSFEFGPLPIGTYSINLSLEDSATGILYKNQLNDLSISKNSESLYREAELIPMDQTVIIASVTTPNDRPVENANVFLYSNATLLKTYQGAGGFVDSGVTNRLGKAAFVNHAPGNYYLYTELVIVEDTLTSNVTDLDLQSVSANTLNEITVQLEF